MARSDSAGDAHDEGPERPVNIYGVAAILRDINALRRGRLPQRLWNRAVGRALAALGRSLYR